MAAEQALAAVAANGLPTSLIPRPDPLGQSDWRALHNGAQSHRLAGHLAWAISAGAFATTETQTNEAADLDAMWQRHAMGMERLLLSTLAVLSAAGVDARVFKGPALAHTVYPDPAQRVFGDIDLLVPGAHLARARSALVEALAAVDVLPELRPGFDAEFAKDVMLRVETAEIDLHRTLAAGPFGLRIPVDTLFESASSFQLAGVAVPTLSPIHTFLQVCYNAALGDIPPRLLSLRDVAQVWLVSSLSVDDVISLATEWGGRAVVGRAVSLAWNTLGLEPCELSDWAAAYSPGALDRRLLAASVSQSRSYTRRVAALAAIEGVGARARYVRAIVSPSPEYLAARGWTRTRHLRRAWRRLRG